MTEREIRKFIGSRTGVEIRMYPMKSQEIWDRVHGWKDSADLLETLENRYDREAESGSISPEYVKNLKMLKEEAAILRTDIVKDGYNVVLEHLAGEIIMGDSAYSVEDVSALMDLFPFNDTDKLADLHEIVSDYMSSHLPSEEMVKNSERES
jgi:hypothetical protein